MTAFFDLKPVLLIVGALLSALALFMLLPALADATVGNPDWRVFALSAAITAFTGILFILANRSGSTALGRHEAFLVTALAWIAISAFSALPFMFSDLRLPYTDAFFEAVSGLTTTGSTVITGLEFQPPGILLWRGLLQWLGGIGIIVMAVAILPFLQVGGMQLFHAEWSDRSEKLMPRPGQIGRAIGSIYLALTAGCALAYWEAGMSGFDAVVHAMTTLSTGGFSNYDSSMGHFSQPAVHWIGVAFMVLGSLPFAQYVRSLRGNHGALWNDSQVRAFATLLVGAILTLTLWLGVTTGRPFLEDLRLAAFNVVSIVTTTGYATADYTNWGQGIGAVFLVLTLVGGCTGSTSGAIKVFRLQIMALIFRYQLRRLIFPHGVFHTVYDEREVSTEVLVSVMGFMFLFVVTLALLTLALAALGFDMVTSLSGAATAICNVGPGLGSVIGPAGNFAPLPDTAKWLLAFGMLAGRLELLTVMVLVTPRFWIA